MKVLRSLFQYAGKYKYLMILSLVFSAISAVILLLPFFFIWKVLDQMISVYENMESSSDIMRYGWYAFYVAVVGILVYVAALMCSHLSAFRIAANMRKAMMKHVMELPMGFLQSEGTGKIRKIIDEASTSTETFLAHQLPDYVQMMVTLIVLVILLFVFDFRFGIAALIPLALAGYHMSKMMGKDLQVSMKEYMDALENMSNEAVEYVRGIPVVKTFQQTVYSFHRFHQTIKDYEKFAIGYALRMRIPLTSVNLWINSIFIFLIGLVMFFLLRGIDVRSYLSDFLFYVIFTPILAVTFNKIMFASENTMLAQDALNRVNFIMDQKPFTYTSDESVNRYDIEFKDVSFHYPGSEEIVLDHINLHIKENETVAFVGPSGSGKSTLVSLIPRFYDVNQGEITIGGINIKEFSESSLLDMTSFVFQDAHLLSRSIYENIKMGTSSTREEVMETLKEAQCEDIVENLENGIDTDLGTQGTYVSGGEAQRLTIARAMVKKAKILLLDEASAFADADNELKIQKAIQKLSRGTTTIMIAHRLSTIINVDKIFVLEKGKIVESGKHDELVKQDGLYAKMWNEYCRSIEWKVGK